MPRRMLSQLPWWLMMAALIGFAFIYSFHEFGWEGLGPELVATVIGIPLGWFLLRRS
jgi:hypothetical protein